VRHPAIAALPYFHKANARKGHVKACDKQLFGRKHFEHSFASGDSLVLVVVHFEMPFRALNGHHVLRACIGGDHDPFAIAFNMEGKQSGRVAGSVDRRNAGNDFVAGLMKVDRSANGRHIFT